MKICDIPYDLACQRHPEAVASILKEAGRRLKRSKAKNKGLGLSELTWSYECSVTGRCGSVWGFFTRPLEGLVKKPSLETMVSQRLEATRTVLFARMSGSYGCYPISNPPEIETWAKEEFTRAGYIPESKKETNESR